MKGKQINLRITEICMGMVTGINKQIIVQQTLIIAITNVQVPYCHYCKIMGHSITDCRKLQKLESSITCAYCNAKGHLQGDDQGCGSWIWLKLQEVLLYDK